MTSYVYRCPCGRFGFKMWGQIPGGIAERADEFTDALTQAHRHDLHRTVAGLPVDPPHRPRHALETGHRES